MSWTAGTIAVNASNFWQIFLVLLQYMNENLCLTCQAVKTRNTKAKFLLNDASNVKLH